ncbi:hypothetical protein GCM10009846_22340 [Agrococcus versicolor]|uniref:Potassium-transporting ATPase n=1 Tax=Agrococcus versicolor TaxID=501482 RepID=A0ABP5MJN2_9MICO
MRIAAARLAEALDRLRCQAPASADPGASRTATESPTMLDLIVVASAIAIFALLGLAVRGVERL